MFLSKKDLKNLIENFLLEETDPSDSEEQGKNIVAVSQGFDINAHKFNISINNETGVAVDIQSEGKEKVPFSIDKDESGTVFEEKKDKLRNILAGIGMFVKKKKSRKDDYQSLIKAINIYFEEQLLKSDKTFRTHLVRFESEFGMVK